MTSTDFFKYLGWGVDEVLKVHTNLFRSLTIVLVKAVRSENKWVYHLHAHTLRKQWIYTQFQRIYSFVQNHNCACVGDNISMHIGRTACKSEAL